MQEISPLIEFINIIHNLLVDSDPTHEKAIAPLVVMAAAAAVQAGVGMWQKSKANREAKKAKKISDAKEKAEMDKMTANKKQLIARAKMRESISGEMPGMIRAEEKIASRTANSIENYKELGNQSGYQEYLNRALQTEQQTLADLSVKSAEYKLERSKDVDAAIAGMDDIYKTKYDREVTKGQQEQAGYDEAKRVAAGNISGAFNTAASGATMAAGGSGGSGGAGMATSGMGGNYLEYKKMGGTMSRRDWRSMR